jgi:hypothetical protein
LTELSRWIDDQVQFAIEMNAILPTDERSIFGELLEHLLRQLRRLDPDTNW